MSGTAQKHEKASMTGICEQVWMGGAMQDGGATKIVKVTRRWKYLKPGAFHLQIHIEGA